MTPKPTALVIAFSDLARDPRVHRQIEWLRGDYRVVAAGLAPPADPDMTFIPVEPRGKGRIAQAISVAQLLLGRADDYYWRQIHIGELRRTLSSLEPSVIVANDLATLPLAVAVGPGKVVFDAHEYAPGELATPLFRIFFRRYRERLCRDYIPRASAMMTVAPAIRDQYERDTGVRAELLLNLPAFHPELAPKPVDPSGKRIRLVHHGRGFAARGLEQLIEAMRYLEPRFELDFYLIPDEAEYMDGLRRLAAPDARIRFRDPVPMTDLPRMLNEYDLGVFLLEPDTFNNRYALPNKLFEFIQGRVGVAIGPSPEMSAVVRRTGAGVVSPDFDPRTFAAMLNGLSVGSIDAMKQSAHEAAKEYSGESSRLVFRRIVDRVANSSA